MMEAWATKYFDLENNFYVGSRSFSGTERMFHTCHAGGMVGVQKLNDLTVRCRRERNRSTQYLVSRSVFKLRQQPCTFFWQIEKKTAVGSFPLIRSIAELWTFPFCCACMSISIDPWNRRGAGFYTRDNERKKIHTSRSI